MAGLLVSLGIIFGDIGTSPLYVMKAIVGDRLIHSDLVLGGLSCVFWTLTTQTTIKYVLLALEADNRGEGGVFALYALVRRKARWLIYPAILGAAAMLADGMITPPISVSSAIEGLRILDPEIPTIPIVILIIILLFSVQHFGTKAVGRSFGPIMLVWFSMLAFFGAMYVLAAPEVLLALNPYYGYKMLVSYPGGFWLLSGVFLCTTGAESLYSDLGHCGKDNIRISWIFVKSSLVLNYFGQGGWLLLHHGDRLNGRNPFYALMPEWFLIFGIVIATLAATIASQALISGSFTLVNEAMRLYFFPKVKVVYPTDVRGQIYVPAVNFLLMLGCIVVALYFRESSNMEAAYGLAITVTMIATTLLLAYYLMMRRFHWTVVTLFVIFYLATQVSFMIANLVKFTHGGWVTILISGAICAVMWVWHEGSMIKRRYTEYDDFQQHLGLLKDISLDMSVPKYATHLVYLTGAPLSNRIEKKIIYSIFQKRPKRADVYWFLHVDVLDEPYTAEYKVEALIPGRAYRIDFMLGFRIEPRINMLFRKVIEEMAANKEIDITSRYESLKKEGLPGDFRFVVLKKVLASENDLPFYEQLTMNGYMILKSASLTEEESFGLDTSTVSTETVPMIVAPIKTLALKRVA